MRVREFPPAVAALEARQRVEFHFGHGVVAVEQLISDDFFRLAHNDRTGKPLLHPVALSVGLAAGVLADLAWSGHVLIRGGEVAVASHGQPPPLDGLSGRVFRTLLSEEHRLPVWLEFLARGARQEVAARMVAAGHVRLVRGRLRSSPLLVPSRPLEASRPRAVLANRLTSMLPIPDRYVTLGGLMAATGLDADVLDGYPEGRAYLRHLMAQTYPPMRELFAHTEAAVGAAILAHRT